MKMAALRSRSSSRASLPPPWEVLDLISHRLDPKTLAVASCVSKSWFISMSSDHIWQPICTTHYLSLSTLKTTNTRVPYHRLYAMGISAAKLRAGTPSKPRLGLQHLIFAITLGTKKHPNIVNVSKPTAEILGNRDGNNPGVFRFDLDVNCDSLPRIEVMEETKISWNVVLSGWTAVFTMMDCEEKAGFAPGSEGWFSEELPSPGCCSRDAMSGVVADLKLGFCSREKGSGEKIRVEKVIVGMLSVVNWRYVSVDDGLRFLQHYLLPLH